MQNIYAKTREECEEKLATLIKTMKAEIAEMKRQLKPKQKRVTLPNVYEEYCLTGRLGKAYGTTRKQDSLWNNHISKSFGSRFIDSISVSEVVNYLSELYYHEGKAYRYVESFLKMFYLLF